MNCKRIAVPLAVLLCGFAANAVPAYPGLIHATQPDGTEVSFLLRGDENGSRVMTGDGYTLLRDAAGYWTFARPCGDGAVASELIYRGSSLPAREAGIEPGLAVAVAPQAVRTPSRAGSDLQVDESFPSSGNRRLLMLLVNYGDTQPLFGREAFDRMMNADGYNGSGSFRDYYLEASYGKLDIATTVTRWVTLPHPKDYYGSEGAVEMIRDALTILDSEIDLKEFDNDGDGILDGLAVIHQGAGQESTGDMNDIWSHSSTVSGMEFDGVQVRRYTIEPELFGTSGWMSSVGVVCHEFGHNLGAPDFYDTDYSGSGGDYPGTGLWDLMGSGAWNGQYGDRPAGMNMWQKIQLGWCEPVSLTASVSVTGMPSADSRPVAYRFDTTVPGEYFILENRQRNGHFDSALPGHGLIIYHVSEAMIRRTVGLNTLNASYPQAMYTVCASALCDPDEYFSSYGDVNSSGATFPGSTGATVFDDYSIPSAKSVSGRNSYKGLGDITEAADGSISFNFVAGETPVAPVDFTATATRGVVHLSWRLPEGAGTLRHFSVYRNAELVATTTDTEYVDDGITSESITEYFVDATYDNGLVSPYAVASVRIPANFVADLAAEPDTEAGTVKLTWSVGTRLSRNTSMEYSEVIDYNVPSLDYVHRFTAKDLSVFKGYKIRRIGFMPYQGPREVSFTLRVWEADDDGSNPRVISERAIKEFGALTWNDILLTSPVEIGADKELWLGVHCESNSNLVKIINDKTGNGAGLGNWLLLGDGDWGPDDLTESCYYMRFTLSEPESGEPSVMQPDHEAADPATDLSFPLGFTVYRDNRPVGSTGNRCFIDTEPLNGVHTYSVASYYKGDNESAAANIEVVFGESGIDEYVVAPTSGAVTSGAGWIALPGYSGTLTVADIAGRVIAVIPEYTAGSQVALAPGVYLVCTSSGCHKAAVRY